MKFCVIGLGRLGSQVAKVLAENGMEVMAIDAQESIVASLRDQVTQAICMRVIDEESLRSVGIDEMNTVIVAMGENFAQSILITALLKKRLGIKEVIARGINEIHKEILMLVGADRVVLPEKEIGIRLADNLSSPFMELIRITTDFAVSQLYAPKAFVGKKVTDLDLFQNYYVRCIGIKNADGKISPIDPTHVVTEKDRLIFAGNNEDLEKIAKL